LTLGEVGTGRDLAFRLLVDGVRLCRGGSGKPTRDAVDVGPPLSGAVTAAYGRASAIDASPRCEEHGRGSARLA
jgi:hypothetical protein